jgi:hypothetical protein
MTAEAPRPCPSGHPMRVVSRFQFVHEPGDSPRDRAMLERLAADGLELGAAVTVWRCERCDVTEAIFAEPEEVSE